MKKIRVFFDKEGNTLDVWFEKPRKVISEETGEEVILKKDPKTKKVIGFEKLNLSHLICMIEPENIGSQKVAQRIGMSLEKKVDLPFEGVDYPILIYSIHKVASEA